MVNLLLFRCLKWSRYLQVSGQFSLDWHWNLFGQYPDCMFPSSVELMEPVTSESVNVWCSLRGWTWLACCPVRRCCDKIMQLWKYSQLQLACWWIEMLLGVTFDWLHKVVVGCLCPSLQHETEFYWTFCTVFKGGISTSRPSLIFL